MTALGYITGKVESRPCQRCGKHVRFAEHGTAPSDEGPFWLVDEEHDGPCGLPCFGGGVSGREGLARLRAGQVHGHPRRPCPKCVAGSM